MPPRNLLRALAVALVLGLLGVVLTGTTLAASTSFFVPATAGPQDGRADGLGTQQGSGLVDSGFTLHGSDSITVTATGTARTGTGQATLGPNGVGSGGCLSIFRPTYLCPAPSAPAFSLVAKVGDGPWQFVGAGPTTLTGTGPVLFAYNDGRYDDNQGGFTVTVGYSPTYNVCPLFDQAKAAKQGSTIPVKLELCDANGNDLSDSSITVHAVSLTRLDDGSKWTPDDSGKSNPGGNFRFDPTLGESGGYIFNLSTKSLPAGSYELSFSATGDISSAETYSVQFVVR